MDVVVVVVLLCKYWLGARVRVWCRVRVVGSGGARSHYMHMCTTCETTNERNQHNGHVHQARVIIERLLSESAVALVTTARDSETMHNRR